MGVRLPPGVEPLAVRSNSSTLNGVKSWASTSWRPSDNHLSTMSAPIYSSLLPERDITTNQTRLPSGRVAHRFVPGTATQSLGFGSNGFWPVPYFSQFACNVFGLKEADFCCPT